MLERWEQYPPSIKSTIFLSKGKNTQILFAKKLILLYELELLKGQPNNIFHAANYPCTVNVCRKNLTVSSVLHNEI
jgi:hypothetical protein